MGVAGEVYVDLVVRLYEALAAAGAAALDAENGAERGFSEGGDNVLAEFAHGLGQSDGCCGLAFPGGRRRDACHDDHLAASAVVADGVEGHLRLVVPIGDYGVGTQPKLLSNIHYGAHGSASLPCFLRSLPDSDSQDQSQHTSTDTVICPISYDANCSTTH